MRVALALAAFVALGSASCEKRENVGTIAGPPLLVDRDASSPAAASAAPPSSAPSSAPPASASAAPSAPSAAQPEAPVRARFVVGKTEKIDDGLCEWTLVAAAKGKTEALGESLAQGDVLVVAHGMPFEVRALGTAAVARVPLTPCTVRARPAPEKTVVRAGAAPRLTWAGGAMNAHLDVGPPLSRDAYMGRLYGTAGVAEHDHPTSWEILFALEASGTFTLAGQPRRLGPGEIVFVPPGAKHSWTPDPGAPLTAVQMYVPPGPEQRFKQLAGAK